MRKIKEHPILFNGPMVRAILDGQKTMTRRMTKLPEKFHLGSCAFENNPHGDEDFVIHGEFGNKQIYCPYGSVGDRLFVKETHYLFGYWIKNGFTKTGRQRLKFRCVKERGVRFPDDTPTDTCTDKRCAGWFKRHSIFMPRWASRITLEIIRVRVERLQEITSDDAEKEGWPGIQCAVGALNMPSIVWFRHLWDSINAKRGFGWDANLWVWVIEFKRIKK
jgi:hypothetical protein